MPHAYTPGLTVASRIRLQRTRRLPLKGEVLCSPGEQVSGDRIVARTELPGPVTPVNLSRALSVPPAEVPACLRVAVGGAVREHELLAERRSCFGLFRRTLSAPAAGTLESLSEVTGQAILRGPPLPVEIAAHLDGRVVEVLPGEGAVLEAVGSLVQGIFGLGGEARGPLVMAVDGPDEVLDHDRIERAHQGQVLVGGALVTADAFLRAARLGVAAVVTGGFHYCDVKRLLGRELEVAVTGEEELGCTLVITEGFGRMNMAGRTFELLGQHAGKRAAVNGATQIRAGVIRPEVFVPASDLVRQVGAVGSVSPAGLQVGARVRAIRHPHFGRLGRVTALPVEPQALLTESRARVLEVEFDEGGPAVIPRANVELIEG